MKRLITLCILTLLSPLYAEDSFLLIESRELFVEELHEQGHTVKQFYHNWLQQKKERCVKELCQAFDITDQEWHELQEKASQMSIFDDDKIDLAGFDTYYRPVTDPKAALIYSLIEQIWGSSKDFYVIDCVNNCTHFRGALGITFVFNAEDKERINGRKTELLLICSLDLFNSLPSECALQMIKHELTHLKSNHSFQNQLLHELLIKKRKSSFSIAYQNLQTFQEFEADILPALENSESARIMELGRRILQASYVPVAYEHLPTCLACRVAASASRYIAPDFLQSTPPSCDYLRLLQCIHQDLKVEEDLFYGPP